MILETLPSSEQKGSLGVRHLPRFLARMLCTAGGAADAASQTDWVADNTLISGLRLGLRETYEYILRSRPSLAEFENWIAGMNGGSLESARVERLNAALSPAGIVGEPADPNAAPALSAADLEFWDRNGYVIVHDAISPENCRAAVDAICDFLEVKLDKPDTWYVRQGHTIWIPLLHHAALWANRESPRIRRAFAQLWNREDLWVNVDQAGFNPPERPGWPFPGPHLHWDTSIRQPIPFGLQGILYLADVAPNQGAFTCVPGFHKRIGPWLATLPEGSEPRKQDLSVEAVPIAGRAGDMVIWHHALPHGSSPNRASSPRIVQYLQYRPSHWEFDPVWR